MTLRCSTIGDDDVGLCQFVHYNKESTANHRVLFALKNIAYLYGMLYSYAFWHVYDKCIDAEHCIKCHNTISGICYIII